MKTLKIGIPLIVAVILVLVTEFTHMSGVPLVIMWVIGFLFSMIVTAVIEIRTRMQEFAKQQKEEEKQQGEK
ncbi:AbrB protein [Pediococcus pentosaceus]|uniref:AbrB protein n=1 Tax=Pediococcus pentosaceus TaxID=1255 RepID=UPI0018A17225|nr:AbrB protein [Pediococcus pentosaceus]MBF7110079.1 AbrB protein [Pediococcus pentosaceus]QQA91742.1 AbrB protein [Pediococcus pentosaceus]